MNCDVRLGQFWFNGISIFTRRILKWLHLKLITLLTELKGDFTSRRRSIHDVSIQSGFNVIDLWLDIWFSNIIVASIFVQIFLRWIFIIIECRQRAKKINLLILCQKKLVLMIISAARIPSLLITAVIWRWNIALTIKISNSWSDHHA